MAHYDIFRDQLAIRYPGYGHALWEPSPVDPHGVVGIGDVGYISQGRFNRLFNIFLTADHPSHENYGVPDNHEPFKPNVLKHIISSTLCPDNFCSAGVTLESDGLEQFATRLPKCTIQVSSDSSHILSDQETPGRSRFRAEGRKAQYYPFQYEPRVRIP